MNSGVIVWLVIFALSAACFLVVAVVVSIKGFGDLRTLLRQSRPVKPSLDPKEEVDKFFE